MNILKPISFEQEKYAQTWEKCQLFEKIRFTFNDDHHTLTKIIWFTLCLQNDAGFAFLIAHNYITNCGVHYD